MKTWKFGAIQIQTSLNVLKLKENNQNLLIYSMYWYLSFFTVTFENTFHFWVNLASLYSGVGLAEGAHMARVGGVPTNIVDKNILCGLLANIYPLTNSLTKLYFIGIPNKKLSFIEINCQFIKVIDFNNC